MTSYCLPNAVKDLRDKLEAALGDSYAYVLIRPSHDAAYDPQQQVDRLIVIVEHPSETDISQLKETYASHINGTNLPLLQFIEKPWGRFIAVFD